MLKLTRALEDYLECIYILNLKNLEVRITDISNFLKTSKPSVNRAVKLLCAKGYVIHEKYAKITLTNKGKEVAKEIYFRHESICNFFIKSLGISPKTAETDACKIEHIISPETLERLVEYSNKHIDN